MESLKKAILLSGGMDSICLAYGLKPDLAYTINYGQNVAEREIYVSKIVCNQLEIEHKIIEVDCRKLGSGCLAEVNKHEIAPSPEWWPYRNQLLVTLGLMQGIKDNITELHLASVKSDVFHKDGTQTFYKLINALCCYQEGNIKVRCDTTPYYTHELAQMYKVPYELLSISHSCHISNVACGTCNGCKKNLRVRYELNLY